MAFNPPQPSRRLIGRQAGQRALGRLPRHESIHRPTRSSTGEFNEAETTAFLEGEWVVCSYSTMVHAARFVAEVGNLEVQFLSGVKWYYPCSRGQAFGFAAAASKGGYLHDTFISQGISGAAI